MSDEYDTSQDEDQLARLGLFDRWSQIADLRAMERTASYPTPFDSLNSALGLGGWYGGNVYVLVGGTGAGKTSIALGLSRFHAEHHGPVIYVSEEMRAGHCVARLTSRRLGVTSNMLIGGKHALSDADLAAAIPERFYIMRRQPVDKIERAALTLAKQGPPPLIVIDYISMLVRALVRAQPDLDPRMATTFASSMLVSLAERCGSPILVISAGGRGSLMKLRPGAGGRPKSVRDLPPSELVDIAKESGDVEYDATAMITLSVSDEVEATGLQVATLTVAKSRYGRAQHIKMAYDGPTAEWLDRGMYVREEEAASKSNGASHQEITAEYIARRDTLAAQALAILRVAPRARASLAKALRELGRVKFRNEEFQDAVAHLLRTGQAVERGSGRSSRIHAADQADLSIAVGPS